MLFYGFKFLTLLHVAQVFGRRIVMLLQILLFAVGSAMCGAAPSMNVLIAGRSKCIDLPHHGKLC